MATFWVDEVASETDQVQAVKATLEDSKKRLIFM